MWCQKCHYGSETVQFLLDDNKQFTCPQCRTTGPVTNQYPFPPKPLRTLGGRGGETKHEKTDKDQ